MSEVGEITNYQKYEQYVRNSKKTPRSFGNWLILMSKLEHHRTIIRPMIIWWQELRKIENRPNYKTL